MTSTTSAAPATATPVTVVTQTRVLPAREDDFRAWQQRVSQVVAGYPGLIDQQVIPPSPPTQLDWVILQKFANAAQAQDWLKSPERLRLIDEVQPMLVGHDDIHLVERDLSGRPEQEVSAIISAVIAPGHEESFRAWNQRITAAEAQYPGFVGHKLSPPLPGVQDDWVTILTFDSEANLDSWLKSPERQALLNESAAFTSGFQTRKVRSGFEQWFSVPGGAPPPPVWKQNMLTLLALYPTVFLFGFFVGTPLFTHQFGLPFYVALFLSNVASVLILTLLVPWISGRFSWWLQPGGADTQRRNIIGAVVICVLYGLLILAFSLFP
jgi:antibiotic biosynthesis monooxygenase (ABM) superfamily enzyme